MKPALLQYARASAICMIFASPTLGQDASKKSKIHGQASPDGTRILYVEYKDGDAEICTARPDGSDRRKLTDNDKIDRYPDWSSDGKQIVFISNRSGQFQVHMMDAQGKNVRQITKEKFGVGMVNIGPKGQIYYTAERDRKYKLRYYDLIVRDGDAARVIEHRMNITEFALHPDGESIVYGGLDRIVFHDFAKDAKTVVKYTDIDRRLNAHGVFQIRWRPDKRSISCRIGFLGGRADTGDGGPKIFGDDEVFDISRDGTVKWSTVKKR